jgi:hypothetical protein
VEPPPEQRAVRIQPQAGVDEVVEAQHPQDRAAPVAQGRPMSDPAAVEAAAWNIAAAVVVTMLAVTLLMGRRR